MGKDGVYFSRKACGDENHSCKASEDGEKLFDYNGTGVLSVIPLDDGSVYRQFVVTVLSTRPEGWIDVWYAVSRSVQEHVMSILNKVKGPEGTVCTSCARLWLQRIQQEALRDEREAPPSEKEDYNVFGRLEGKLGQAEWHIQGGCPLSLNPAGLRGR
jgi:hypothetical protein